MHISKNNNTFAASSKTKIVFIKDSDAKPYWQALILLRKSILRVSLYSFATNYTDLANKQTSSVDSFIGNIIDCSNKC